MQMVSADILGSFPESESRNSHILVTTDYFTRWVEAYPIPDQEVLTVAKKLTNEMFLRFSPREQLHCSQGHQFESRLHPEEQVRKACIAYNSSVHGITGFTPFFI